MNRTSYNVNKQISKMQRILGVGKTDENSYEGFKKWFENYMAITKPDFICFFNLKESEPIVYTENFDLKFGEGKEETIYEIIKSIHPAQITKIFEVDSEMIQIIQDNEVVPQESIIELRFTASLIDKNPRSLLRSSSFLAVNDNNKPYLGMLTITDVTEMQGVSENVSFKLRWTKGVDPALDENLKNLESDMNRILAPDIELTKREREILTLISKGKTSKTIGKELQISAATVNTHRQNIIKKYKVDNTTSLLNLI